VYSIALSSFQLADRSTDSPCRPVEDRRGLDRRRQGAGRL